MHMDLLCFVSLGFDHRVFLILDIYLRVFLKIVVLALEQLRDCKILPTSHCKHFENAYDCVEYFMSIHVFLILAIQ